MTSQYLISLIAISILGLCANALALEPDIDFHIYLCFGQSNMENGGKMNDMDRTVNERFQVMADFDSDQRGWKKNDWYHAVLPLSAKGLGICSTDHNLAGGKGGQLSLRSRPVSHMHDTFAVDWS